MFKMSSVELNMDTLEDMAVNIIVDCIFQLRDEEIKDDQMKTTVQLITYFGKLPCNVREKILTRYTEHDNDYHIQEAHIVALFLHAEQTQLIMEFSDDNFDLVFLLKVNGHILKNLTELVMPDESSLTASACEEICQFMPNLQKLDLSECYNVEDAATIYIANLPLVEFCPGRRFTDYGLRKLCGENSVARTTLRVLKLGRSKVSLNGYCLVLKTMNLIEDVGCWHSKWLHRLSPIDVRQQQYNIRKLSFLLDVNTPENEMDIAVATCPKVSNITIRWRIFTPKMLHTLTKFKKLSILDVDVFVDDDVDVNIEDEYQPFDRLCLDNLVEFSLCDRKDAWISSGYLFNVLDMCPNLEKLELLSCDGFSNKIASELAKMMATKKLKYLDISFCKLLGPYGIEDLLKIASLIELDADLYVSEIMQQHFYAHSMHQVAEKHGVNLHLNFNFPDADDQEEL